MNAWEVPLFVLGFAGFVALLASGRGVAAVVFYAALLGVLLGRLLAKAGNGS